MLIIDGLMDLLFDDGTVHLHLFVSDSTIGNLELRSIRRRQISSVHAEVTAEETAEAGKAGRRLEEISI